MKDQFQAEYLSSPFTYQEIDSTFFFKKINIQERIAKNAWNVSPGLNDVDHEETHGCNPRIRFEYAASYLHS